MEWFYQIKIRVDSVYGSGDYPVAVQGITEQPSKVDVCRWLETEYPEYFEGNKVAQKLSKKTEQLVYVTIFELDDYWKRYWTQEITCAVCGSKTSLLAMKKNLGCVSYNNFACSVECEKLLPEVLEKRRVENTEEYWNKQCSYYYIYRIAHKTNGKCYVGYTEREPVFRWWEHLKHSDLPIGIALQAEGIQNFTFEILECHPKDMKTKQEMHEIETNYILQYNSIENGYNCIVSKAPTTPAVKSKALFNIDEGVEISND